MSRFRYEIAPLLARFLEPFGERLMATAQRFAAAQRSGLVIRARAIGLDNALGTLRQATTPGSPLVRLAERIRVRERKREQDLSRRVEAMRDETHREESLVIRPFIEQSNLTLARAERACSSANQAAKALETAEGDALALCGDLDDQRQRIEALRERLGQLACHRGWP